MMMLFFVPFHGRVYAADYSATINIDTSKVTTYNPDFRGVNNEPERTAIKMNDPSFINAAINYGRIGFVRWPGGTPSNSVSWKLGITDAEYTGQTQVEPKRYYNQLYARRYSIAKGFDRISDLRSFLQQTGTKAVIMVNVFQDTKNQVSDLAQYLYLNHIPVLYFELGNEVSFYVAGVGNQQPEYQSGTDYLDRVKVFNDIIKKEYPGAKTVISMSNNQVAAYDQDIFKYPTPFWNAITTHRFRGDGSTAQTAMESANSYLDSWNSAISYYTSNMNNPKIFLGEYGVKLGGLLSNTQYHGIYTSESILRLVTNPNVTYVAGYRLTNGIFNPANVYTTELEDAYQNGKTVDSSTLNFNPYMSAPAVSLKIVDGAVNQSTTAWGTTVTGGATVQKSGGTTMPALFAQSFKGNNGKDYVVITNKSAYPHSVTINMNGSAVTEPMTTYYTTSTNPLTRNTSTSPTTIAVQSASSSNPIQVPPYSVMRVEWTGSGKPSVPFAPWVMYADINSGSVSLKWQSSLNADGYKVKYGTQPGVYTNTIDVGNTLSANVTGLTNGSTYYFVVTAYNSTGESAVSNEVSASLVKPSAPLIRRVYAERTGHIAIEWQGVKGATGYKVKYGTSPDTYTNTVDAGNNWGQLITGLTPGTTYYFVVTAYNGLGESGNSAAKSTIAAPWLPLAPNDAKITNETSTSITFSWTPTRTNTYHEYFEDGTANGWTQEQGSWSVVDNTSRGVKFYESNISGTNISIFSNSATGNYEGEGMIENAGQATGKSAYSYGLIARYVDNKDYYKFVYNVGQDAFLLVKMQNGTRTVLDSITRTQALKNANAASLDLSRLNMFINVQGSTITCSVNQLGPIMTVTDSSFPTGKFGFCSLNVKANYDWARLYRNNADSYTIYRSTDPHSNFTAIKTGYTGTSYTDSNLTPGTVYYYKITAVNKNGESYGHSNILRKN